MALKAAVEKVVVEHARRRLPIYIWRDGRVVEVPPDELRAQATLLSAGSVQEPFPVHEPAVRESAFYFGNLRKESFKPNLLHATLRLGTCSSQ